MAKLSDIYGLNTILTDEILNNDTAHAPDGNTMFDALALKAPLSGATLTGATVNALTPTALSIGFTLAGGTTSKTLTVDETVALSAKANLTSPALVTPNLGTPSAGTLTNCTGLPLSGLSSSPITSVLTGYTSGAGTLASTDSVLQAIQKLNGNYVSGVNTAQPAFLAQVTNNIGNATGDGTVYTLVLGSVILNVGSCFANNTFTAPVTGKYLLTIRVYIYGASAAHNATRIYIVTSNRSYVYDCNFAAGSNPFTTFCPIITVLADMDVSDTAYVTIAVSGGTKVICVAATDTCLSGYLVC